MATGKIAVSTTSRTKKIVKTSRAAGRTKATGASDGGASTTARGAGKAKKAPGAFSTPAGRKVASGARSAGSRAAGATDWKAAERAAFLIDALGGVSKLAEALGVSKSQPGRWRDGTEKPGATAAKNLLDLDHVMGRASLVWAPDVAALWMNSSNAFLEGAKPIDVLITRGPNDVISALDATMSGAFA